jgi:uncharacterized protein (TIGR00369 family)
MTETPLPITQYACFGCGDQNRSGLRLRFFTTSDHRVLCRLRLARRFMGPPGRAHGGVIATLLDEAMSKANRHRDVFAMTSHLEVDYLRPVPLATQLELEGWSASSAPRKHQCRAELRDPATHRVLARATGLFIEVHPHRLLHTPAVDN